MLELENFLFNIDIPNIEPHSGALLVAEPFLKESYFNHSVVCLIEYEKHEQAMGVVMNKKTDYTLQELVSAVTIPDPIPIYCGGPLSCDRLYYLHTLGEIIPGAREIGNGLYVGGDFDSMIDCINSGFPTEGHIRFYLGYSGWDIGQLNDEIRNNVWAVGTMSDNKTLLSGHDDSYWHKNVRLLGHKYRWWRYYPQNPAFN